MIGLILTLDLKSTIQTTMLGTTMSEILIWGSQHAFIRVHVRCSIRRRAVSRGSASGFVRLLLATVFGATVEGAVDGAVGGRELKVFAVTQQRGVVDEGEQQLPAVASPTGVGGFALLLLLVHQRNA